MIIIGGGYIAAEFAHVFAAFGTAVTVLNRSDVLLRREDAEIAASGSPSSSARRVDVRGQHQRRRRSKAPPTGAYGCTLEGPEGQPEHLDAEILLVATGRAPNGDTLDLARGGHRGRRRWVDHRRRVPADQRRRASSRWATCPLVSSSSTSPTRRRASCSTTCCIRISMISQLTDRFVPRAVFSMPQVASVGLTEAEAEEQGIDYVVSREDYGDTAFGWAMEDTDHFVKIIADADSKVLLGAHLIGPQASSLIQPLIQAMSFEQTAPDVARGQYWIHPAMTEVIENALLGLAD